MDGVKLTIFDIKEYLSSLTLAQRSLLSKSQACFGDASQPPMPHWRDHSVLFAG